MIMAAKAYDLYWKEDGHPNGWGYEVMAVNVAERFDRSGLVP